jgi:hypothetical protein
MTARRILGGLLALLGLAAGPLGGPATAQDLAIDRAGPTATRSAMPSRPARAWPA